MVLVSSGFGGETKVGRISPPLQPSLRRYPSILWFGHAPVAGGENVPPPGRGAS